MIWIEVQDHPNLSRLIEVIQNDDKGPSLENLWVDDLGDPVQFQAQRVVWSKDSDVVQIQYDLNHPILIFVLSSFFLLQDSSRHIGLSPQQKSQTCYHSISPWIPTWFQPSIDQISTIPVESLSLSLKSTSVSPIYNPQKPLRRILMQSNRSRTPTWSSWSLRTIVSLVGIHWGL